MKSCTASLTRSATWAVETSPNASGPGDEGADKRADGADHSHPLGKRDGLTGQEATELPFEIVMGGLMVGAVVYVPECVLVALV